MLGRLSFRVGFMAIGGHYDDGVDSEGVSQVVGDET